MGMYEESAVSCHACGTTFNYVGSMDTCPACKKPLEAQEGQFVVGKLKGMTLSINGDLVIHTTRTRAEQEAERLALKERTTFLVFQAITKFEPAAPPIIRTELHEAK